MENIRKVKTEISNQAINMSTLSVSNESFETRSVICDSPINKLRNGEKRLRKEGKIWTNEEDNRLLRAVKQYGESKWVDIAKFVGSRTRKQCRERYINHLNPAIDSSKWTAEEDSIILYQHSIIGSKWCSIARCLNNRTARSIRNRYYSLVNKKYQSSCFSPSKTNEYSILNCSTWF